MIFRAISIGYAIPKEFDAVVHSVFRTAINLQTREDQLITIVTSSEADLPQGIRVDTPDDFLFEIFRAGEQATCQNDSLRLDLLTVELRGARLWKCDLPALQVDPTALTFSSSWNYVWKILNQRQIESEAEIIAENLSESKCPDFGAKTGVFTLQHSVAEKAANALCELREATLRYDLMIAASSVRALTGLGTGLTPTGDDLLVGYLAGLWCTVQDVSERVQFVNSLGREVIRLSHQTNDISCAYLCHAAQGQVSSLLANLAEAICMNWNSDHLSDAAESAIRVGHTSGMDAVTGLLLGLNAWAKEGTKN